MAKPTLSTRRSSQNQRCGTLFFKVEQVFPNRFEDWNAITPPIKVKNNMEKEIVLASLIKMRIGSCHTNIKKFESALSDFSEKNL